MSGRRGFYRYGVTNAGGSLRTVRDVAIWKAAEDEYVVLSDQPEATGESLTLERIVDGAVRAIDVFVIDSYPVIVDGSVRHRLRLRRTGERDHRHRRTTTH